MDAEKEEEAVMETKSPTQNNTSLYFKKVLFAYSASSNIYAKSTNGGLGR